MTRASEAHARHELDPVIHAPVRFSIVAALNGVDEAEFAAVRDAVELSDSALSKQVSQLEQAGYVKVRKGYVGKRPRTCRRCAPSWTPRHPTDRPSPVPVGPRWPTRAATPGVAQRRGVIQ